MYRYSPKDQKMIEERVEQFRDQVRRNLAGSLDEEEFRPLRLQNGLYYQLHAPMLRIAIPYGMLSSNQLRRLGDCAEKYSKGYGHFTTRTNMQYHWPQLEDVPDLLGELAEQQIHAIQTSGNCIRNTTVDQFAGIAADELEDPRPYCEIIRQWSTFHPEFAYLPRKFKIAVSGASQDRAAVKWHDIGLYLVKNEAGDVGFSVWVGGGMGRTPLVSQCMYEFIPKRELLGRLEAIIRVYNLQGNRDNKFKARIKILVKALGMDKLRELVDAEYDAMDKTGLELSDARIEEMKTHFTAPEYDAKAVEFEELDAQKAENPEFSRWVVNNGTRHKVKGYRAMTISLAHADRAPGDVTTAEMHALADLADQYSFGEIRVTHDQNIVFADVRIEDLFPLWQKLSELDLARSNIGLLTDMICCPGLDYCGLADAHSIPIAQSINDYFDDIDYIHDIGHLEIKMSGCMNACGHHHAGHIGIMGRERKGEEFYAIQIGGSRELDAETGKIVGKPVKADEVAPTVKKLLDEYLDLREGEESFIETYQRVGIDPFKAALKA
ncbi:sulphite reductase [gamma proteobacterium HTCC5015]|nr:sulphite reductase [gamma proteobacterium HTCC5015]